MHIGVFATLDTKAAESSYLCSRIEAAGCRAEAIDISPSAWVDPSTFGSRTEVMSAAASTIRGAVTPRVESGELSGVCVIGGATGAALSSDLLANLPYGVPKVLVSPVATSEVRQYIGSSDTIVIPPVVDFTGRNDYADFALDRAAAVVCSLALPGARYPNSRSTHYAATAFGVTSPLAMALSERLPPETERLAIFSANGTGGESFERFVELGLVRGAFDLTLSELADELCGGVLSAGPQRGWAAARTRTPQVMLPGGLDFINFGPLSTVPDELRSRRIVEHTTSVTLVRTSADENYQLGRMVAERAAFADDLAVLVVPRRGFSLLSAPGGPFSDPDADDAFRQGALSVSGARVEEVDAEINGERTVDAVLSASAPWRTTP